MPRADRPGGLRAVLGGKAAEPDGQALRKHLNDALGAYHRALDLLPPPAAGDLAATHTAIGVIYGVTGAIDQALPHYQASIRYAKVSGNRFGAGTTRYSMALALAQSGRLGDALLYARAACEDFRSSEGRAAERVALVESLIADIEQALAGSFGAGPS